jgi:hypothetical protein
VATVSTPVVCNGNDALAHGLAAAVAVVEPAAELDVLVLELPHAAGTSASRTAHSAVRRRNGGCGEWNLGITDERGGSGEAVSIFDESEVVAQRVALVVRAEHAEHDRVRTADLPAANWTANSRRTR